MMVDEWSLTHRPKIVMKRLRDNGNEDVQYAFDDEEGTLDLCFRQFKRLIEVKA